MTPPAASPAHQAQAAFIGGAGPRAPVEFAALAEELGERASPLFHDLLAFRGEPLRPDYSVGAEVEELRTTIDAAELDRPHLVAYSGGAAIALAFASRYPTRVASLALVEPGWIGVTRLNAMEAAFWAEHDRVMGLGRDERLAGFRGLVVAGDAAESLPPVAADAPWVDGVLLGIETLGRLFRKTPIDTRPLHDAGTPIYYAVGSRSNSVFAARGRLLAKRLPRARIDVYEGLHHLRPPHRGAPQRFADALLSLWSEAT